ncbi:MAG: inorganic pyrophosphatase [Thermoprotei archaeon]|nr:MAG: inorganic pyrophosphatase [Thermoprotei archaeon]
MKPLWRRLETGPKPPEVIYVIVEIPKGCRNKYEMDHELGIIKLDRVLHTAFEFPFDYGIIPRTYYYDDDPLDAMVLTRYPTFPGCVIEARPIGLMRMRDEKGEDEKILAVPTVDPYFDKFSDVEDLPPHVLEEIAHFWSHYKDLEKGKWSKVEGWEGASRAKEIILKAMEIYREKFKD